MTGRPSRRARSLAAAAALLALLLTPAVAAAPATPGPAHPSARAAASHPALKMIWGPLDLPDGSPAMPVYRQLGVQVIETQIAWNQIAPVRPANAASPTDPAYRWPAALDQLVTQARAAHISVAIMVKGSPAWANDGRDPSWTPTDPGDYARFLQAASRRYPSVHYWMVWGEVTRAGNYNPMPRNSPVGPRTYAILLDRAYGALKAISPSNIVIGGMTWTVGVVDAPHFIKWMRLPDGRPPRVDFFSHNPYATRFPNLAKNVYAPGVRDISDIDTLHTELAAAYRGRPTPKLWLSEFSVSSDHANRAFNFFVSRAEQARWVTAAFKLVDSVSYVAGLGWYQLLDESPPGPSALTNGLLDVAGKPKPAFAAYARAP